MAETRDGGRKAGIALTAILLGGTLVAGPLVGQAVTANSLQPKAVAALTQAGITDVTVEFKGREAYLTTTTGTKDELDKAKQIVEGVYGVRWATVSGGTTPAPTPTQPVTTPTSSPKPVTSPTASTPAVQPFSLNIGSAGGALAATGAVDSAASITGVLTEAQRVFGSAVANNVTVSPGATPPAWWGDFGAAMTKLPSIDAGTLSVGPTGVGLTGSVSTPEDYDTLTAALQGVPFSVDNKVNLDPALTVTAGADGPVLSGTVASQADADALVAQIGKVFGEPVTNNLTVNPACQGSAWYAGFTTALAGAPAIKGGTLDVSAKGLTIGGTVASADDQAKLAAVLAAATTPGGLTTVHNNVTVTSPDLTAAETAQINATVVNFAGGVLTLDDQAKAKLDAVLPLLTKSTVPITIRGYMSGTPVPSDQANSTQRAQSVADYLIANGVAASRLTVKGMATADQVASNDTEAGRYANQRATLTITEGN